MIILQIFDDIPSGSAVSCFPNSNSSIHTNLQPV
nr:MAG TPA: hypothetical protein [Caudoviricetes sp.]